MSVPKRFQSPRHYDCTRWQLKVPEESSNKLVSNEYGIKNYSIVYVCNHFSVASLKQLLLIGWNNINEVSKFPICQWLMSP